MKRVIDHLCPPLLLALAISSAAVQAVPAAMEQGSKSLGHAGECAKWTKIEISLNGPASRGAAAPNPFGLLVDVQFTGPSGKTYLVPAFYDGDGKGGLDGNVWKVRFSADELGQWTFRSQSKQTLLDGHTGSFTVTSPSSDAADFYRWGRLEAVGTAENSIRYLKFRDGRYWLKAGCDDPENFLGNYQNYDTLEKRKAAIEYLAERGINSLYIMSHNLDGDDKDVWPWLGVTAKEARANSTGEVRFDIAKLNQWRELFEHMQKRGVVVYLVLEDDSAWRGYDHARYYREMIARFGDLPGLVFNLGEEHNENYKLPEGLALAQQLADIDPYDHPRGIHNVNVPSDTYIDAPQIDLTAIQTGAPGSRRGLKNALEHNQLAIDWLRRCRARGKRMLVVNFDEGRPEQERVAWWAAYLAGGVWEAHVLEPYDRPMSSWDKTWTELGGTRAFMESLPFWEMQHDNQLVKSGKAMCLAKPGFAYALYLPDGGSVTVQLMGDTGSKYSVEWWNPANARNGWFQDIRTVPSGLQELTAPSSGDWAVRILIQRR